MKRLIVSSLFVIGLVTASYAAVPVPTDKQNLQIMNPAWTGASTCTMTASTGTSDVLCTTGRGVILGVVVSSGSGVSTDFVTIRDSATANHSSTVLEVHDGRNLLFEPFAFGKFVNGLSLTMNATPGSSETWTILYRLQSDQN